MINVRLHSSSVAVGASLGLAIAYLVGRLLRAPVPRVNRPTAPTTTAAATAVPPHVDQIVALLRELVQGSVDAVRELRELRAAVNRLEALAHHDPEEFVDASDLPYETNESFSPTESEHGEGGAAAAAAPTVTTPDTPGTPDTPDTPQASIFAQVDARTESDGGAEAGAYLKAECARLGLPRTPELLWRLARGAYHESTAAAASADKETQKQVLQEAIALAAEALALDETCANAHKWFAIANGSLTSHVGTKEKIELGFVFQQHVLRAIALNPGDPTNYHLLGRWSLEVASLSWLERKAAAALFGAPPTATFQETLKLFQKAEDIRPNLWISNKVMLGKTLLKMGRTADARQAFSEALTVHVATTEDGASHSEAEKLLMSL